MTRPCGCGGTAADTCQCVIVAGPNTSVTGIGTPENPYVLTAGTAAFVVTDTPTLNLTLSGDGSGGTPYDLSGAVVLDPAAGNLLTATGSGLLVPCTAVQDCVGEAVGPGLTWNAVDRLIEAHISTEPGNSLFLDPDGGLYASDDGTIQPARPRARVGRSTSQQIPNTPGTSHVVQFDQVLIDNAAMFSPGRLTATVDGGYTISTTIQWQNHPVNNGHRGAFLRLNGTTLIGGDQREAAPNASTVQNVTTSYDMVAGDYVEVLVQHTDTNPPNLSILALTDFAPILAMYLTTEGLG